MKWSILLIISLFTMTSCGGNGKKEEAKKELTIGYVDGWAEGVAMTYVTQAIFTSQGYQVETKKAAVDMIFASLSNGDTDVFMDTWLPVTHKEKVERLKGKIESLGVNYNNARIGLVVPKYVTINSIEELNANKDKFDGKIIGIEKGAGITAKTDAAVEEYALELEQMNSSSIAMLTELKKAINENRWIAVAGWAPHWKFGRFDLKFLADPKGIYGSSEIIETYARKGFKEADAFAANYFKKFHLDESQMSNLLAQMENGSDKAAVANKWIEENKDLVNSWLK